MEQLKGKVIGVLMGGLSPEREISLSTGNAVLQVIREKGLNVVAIDVSCQIAEQLSLKKVDLAFVALHGTFGEDGAIQGVLEYLKIPYTGSGLLGSAVAFNKAVSKSIFKAHDIPTPDYKLFYRGEDKQAVIPLPLPLVVKPSDQGSSLGITIVKQANQWKQALDIAFEYSKQVIVESFIAGKLLAIGMDEDQPLPIVQIIPRSEFYDYEAKYTPGKTDYHCPADLTERETEECHKVAIRTVRALCVRGICRVDVILDEKGMPQVLELNTIPGLTPTSLLPKAARAIGLEFEDLVLKMLLNAQRDYLN